jgi:hypothetical protein
MMALTVWAEERVALPEGSDDEVSELLEFLGSWDDGEGNWLDPLSLEAEENDESQRDQDTQPAQP